MPLPGNRQLCEYILTKGMQKGSRCKNPRLKGYVFCRHHVPTVDKMEQARPLFGKGDYKLKLPESEDQELFEVILAGLQAEFTMNNSSDMMNLEMASYYFMQWRKAVVAGKDNDAIKFDALVQRNLSALSVTRSTRPAGESTVRTPADVAADIMSRAEQYEAANKKADKKKARAEKAEQKEKAEK